MCGEVKAILPQFELSALFIENINNVDFRVLTFHDIILTSLLI